MSSLIDSPPSSTLPFPAVLVYETVLNGPAGSAMARFARDIYRADTTVRLGPSGYAYGLPVGYTTQRALPAPAIINEVRAFFDHAREYPETPFMLTALGRRRARIRIHESAILAAAANAPSNVELPGAWRHQLAPENIRVAVVGKGPQVVEMLERSLEPLLARGATVEIVRGLEAGDDTEVERLAASSGVPVVRFPPLWQSHKGLAPAATSIVMTWYASHVWVANARPGFLGRELLRQAQALQLPITQCTTSSR